MTIPPPFSPGKSITLRPANLQEDLPRILEIRNSCNNPPPWTLDFITHLIEARQPKQIIQEMVTQEKDLVTGYTSCTQPPYLDPGQFMVTVFVDPLNRGKGAGNQLYEASLAFALKKGARELKTFTRDDDPAIIQFAAHRGFIQDHHIFDSTLHLPSFNQEPFKGVIEAARQKGFDFFPLAGLGGYFKTGEFQQRYYKLYRSLFLDIPGMDSFSSFEEFRHSNLEAGFFNPEVEFLVAQGEEWVGLASVNYIAGTENARNILSGILPAFRQQGLGTALKLFTVLSLREMGITNLITNNDALNAPILGLNHKMGYLPLPGAYRWYKLL